MAAQQPAAHALALHEYWPNTVKLLDDCHVSNLLLPAARDIQNGMCSGWCMRTNPPGHPRWSQPSASSRPGRRPAQRNSLRLPSPRQPPVPAAVRAADGNLGAMGAAQCPRAVEASVGLAASSVRHCRHQLRKHLLALGSGWPAAAGPGRRCCCGFAWRAPARAGRRLSRSWPPW